MLTAAAGVAAPLGTVADTKVAVSLQSLVDEAYQRNAENGTFAT